MKIKCLIVDDEELALNVLENYISTLPSLQLVGKCENALEAISFLHNNEVDLLFLDLNMPELSGLDMLKTLSDPPLVILTTAYSEFALESYEYGVVDYLLKPIKLERFIKSVNKVVQMMRVSEKKPDDQKQGDLGFLFIKEDQTSYNVAFNDVFYVEAYGNYLKIHTHEKSYVTRETMQHLVESLPVSVFLRIHKSYIINLGKVVKIYGNTLHLNDVEIPIGTTYKSELLKRLK